MTTRTTRTTGTRASRPSRLVMARSRGAVAGPLLMILGAWGALIPFFGHGFNYGFTPDNTWTWTAARGWLEVLPGGAAFLGGLLLTVAGNRVLAMIGGWLAAAAGAWFVLGLVVQPWWDAGKIGTPTGSTTTQVWEQIGMFSGLGVLIVLLAGIAIGRSSVIGVRDVAAAEARRDEIVLPADNTAPTTAGQPATTPPTAAPATTSTRTTTS
jgi:hypothetical protein